MIYTLRVFFSMFVLITLVTGVIYPVAVTGIGKVLFAHQAAGSLIKNKGKVRGAEFIGQQFTSAKYFYSRPSAAGNGYDASSSSSSNLALSNNELIFRVNQHSVKLKTEQRSKKLVPVDLVTASASGLDPHISVASAYYQIPRIVKARKIKEEKVEELVNKNIEERFLGIFGERKVNVLKLNKELDVLGNE